MFFLSPLFGHIMSGYSKKERIYEPIFTKLYLFKILNMIIHSTFFWCTLHTMYVRTGCLKKVPLRFFEMARSYFLK